MLLDLLILMGTPALVFLQALALVGPAPSQVGDWTAQFYSNRKRFFILNVFMILVTGAGGYRYGTIALAPLGILLLLTAIGIATDNRRTHAAIACLATAIVATGIGIPIIAIR